MVAGQTYDIQMGWNVAGDIGDVFTFCNSVSGKELDDSPVSSK